MEGVDLPKRRSGSDEGEEDQMEVDESAGRSQSAKKAMKAISDVRIDYSKLPREHKKDMQDKEMKKVCSRAEIIVLGGRWVVTAASVRDVHMCVV